MCRVSDAVVVWRKHSVVFQSLDFRYPFKLSDINECGLNTDRCAHFCSNTVGSYTCSCRSGYRLTANGRTCTGMNKLHMHICQSFT